MRSGARLRSRRGARRASNADQKRCRVSLAPGTGGDNVGGEGTILDGLTLSQTASIARGAARSVPIHQIDGNNPTNFRTDITVKVSPV
jgi:hypothetical protein